MTKLTKPQHLRPYVQGSNRIQPDQPDQRAPALPSDSQLCNALHHSGHPHDPCLLWPKMPVVAFQKNVANWIRFVLNVLALFEEVDAHLQPFTYTVWRLWGKTSRAFQIQQ